MSTLQVQVSRPEDAFQDFFRSFEVDAVGSKYRKRLGHAAVNGEQSLTIDFEDLITFDPALARNVVEHPDDFVGYATSAATAQMRVEDPEYAEFVGLIHARFRGLPERTLIRRVGSEHLHKMVRVDGIVVRTGQVRPIIVTAVFRCKKCSEVVKQDQTGDLMRGPGTCPSCKQTTSYELLEKESRFKNTQEARVQERPEDLSPGQLPRYLDVRLDDDLVDSARPGDRVALSAIVRPERQTMGEKGKLRTFNMYHDANFVEIIGKETVGVEITIEDEKGILEAAKDPWIDRKLTLSIAPSIYGYEDIKEAILYLLLGGVPKKLPDGVSIRGDSHTLIIGDPGCLVADERIVLGNGTIAKMEDLGQSHLQEIRVQVQTAQGGGSTDWATRFHVYRQQPTMEIITESGKSIRGTHNHPLLAIENQGALVRSWKRLDEFKVGDRVAVVPGFRCSIRKFIDTGWEPLPYKRGPRFNGRLPRKVTPELGGLIGYVLGDGYVQKYRFGFTVAEGKRDVLEQLLDYVEESFGIRPVTRSGKRKNRTVVLHEVAIKSQHVANSLRFLREKRVPSLILQSGNRVVSSFLKWLYEADGTVFSLDRGCGVIALKAKNIELLRDVQLLLLRYSIHSRIIGNALLIRRGESIEKFASKIGFASEKKRTRLALLNERARKLKRVNRQLSEKIVKIIQREPSDVYDVEIPKTHRFIANGIVSHNTAKSQLLQYVARIAPRGLYTSGRGSSAAGLTAAVLREKTGGMVLEAGALVLADKGIAAIDEIDKMLPVDRVAIHEAMEQQTVSVAKGGIVATLNARASILAAGNPKLGRYDPFLNVGENINLDVTILSRFDLIFLLRDEANRERDARMAEHILALHKTKVNPEAAPFEPNFLRKYISYAKRINPTLTPEAMKELLDFYLKMRSKGGSKTVAVAITPRQLEALVRLAEARARAFLRDQVKVEDARSAIRLVNVSMGDVGVDVTTGATDIDVIMTGIPRSFRDNMQKIIEVILELSRESGSAEQATVLQVLKERENIQEGESLRLLGQLIKDGIIYTPQPGRLKRVSG